MMASQAVRLDQITLHSNLFPEANGVGVGIHTGRRQPLTVVTNGTANLVDIMLCQIPRRMRLEGILPFCHSRIFDRDMTADTSVCSIQVRQHQLPQLNAVALRHGLLCITLGQGDQFLPVCPLIIAVLSENTVLHHRERHDHEREYSRKKNHFPHRIPSLTCPFNQCSLTCTDYNRHLSSALATYWATSRNPSWGLCAHLQNRLG